MKGEIVGINTAILGPGANIGIGFSIPSNMVQSVVTQLLKYGKVERGMLGVIAQNITPPLAAAMHLNENKGTVVSDLIPGSAADKAGIKTQDVITSINGRPIQSAVQLRNTLGVMRPGSILHITLLRNHKTKVITATVASPNAQLKQKVIPFLAGMKLHDFKELEDDGSTLTGSLVIDIQPTSQAALAGVQPGDIITEAHNQKINTTQDLVRISKSGLKNLLIKVKRGPMAAFMVLEQPLG
tara:strand:- start:262 stop:984 length:723 start_codon:yes stop_codon:yes gene_type:complete